MPKIEDLDEFLRVCRGQGVYVPEADERFRRCVLAAVRNGFGGSDLSGLESASDRKFVLRREIPADEVGSYAASFKTLVRDYEEYLSCPKTFLSTVAKIRPRRFQKRKAA
jgi:hypothetical protein